jgi:hypothetical protein
VPLNVPVFHLLSIAKQFLVCEISRSNGGGNSDLLLGFATA